MNSPAHPEKTILHLDLDTFFVSVERLLNPKLNGIPVIIGGGGQLNRGVVSACSYEARKFGVHSAMPIARARELCPDATYIRGSYEQYARYSDQVTEIIAAGSPLFEKASVDEFYIDLTGMDRFHGSLKWAVGMKQAIKKETGLPVSFGLSINKTIAKIATDFGKPDGQCYVPAGEVLSFLAPLSVSAIPGVGNKSGQMLQEMGIFTIGQLQNIPSSTLKQAFGEWGNWLWKKARGIDDELVKPFREEKSISRETTLQDDTIDLKILDALLTGMADELAYELRGGGRLASCITVKLRYIDFDTHTAQYAIHPTANEQDMLPVARKLLRKLFSRRLRVRLVGLKLSGLCQGNMQQDLFRDNAPILKLRKATDGIRNRFGKDAIGWAGGIPPES